MTDETPGNNEGNPPTARKAWYHIIIETDYVEDTEWQAEEVTALTAEWSHDLSFNASMWLDDVEYETDEPNSETP